MGVRLTLESVPRPVVATLKCGCSEVIIKSQDGVEKVRAKVLLIKGDRVFAVCKACNEDYKHTYFPLKNPIDRARNHHQNEDKEIPFLVDPVGQDPREHIQFVNDAAIGKTQEGKVP